MPTTEERFDYRRFIAPVHWPMWLGLGILRLSSYLPYPWMMRLGAMLGNIGFVLMAKRRRIIRTNLRACFPEYNETQIRHLMRLSFCSSAQAVFESALAWWGREAVLRNLYHVEGIENIQQALALNKGVLLLGGHYTTIEISNTLMSYTLPNYAPTYKRAHSKLFEAVMTAARRRIALTMIRSRDMRAIIHYLKQKNMVWYAPDQDFGTHSSVFAPFMGVPAVTLTLTARIAKTSGCAVVPFYSERLPNNQGYVIRFGKMLTNFPSDDAVRDATQVNHAIEAQVRRTPEQYLWGHRRFRTRPRGEPLFYPHRRDSRLRRYSLLLWSLALPAVAYTGWLAWRHRISGYFSQRLGIGSYTAQPVDIWIHAASVGEVNAVMPLIQLLHLRHPERSLLLTVNTPSGYHTAMKQLPEGAQCCFLPIDWHFAVSRFLQQIRPGASLVVETEIWPNLYLEAQYLGCPITIINGRLSTRTVNSPFIILGIIYRALETVFAVLARSELDAARFKGLAYAPDYTWVQGNLKFAAPATPSPPFEAGQPYVLAASTRPGEEAFIATCWKKLALEDYLLVIVPRHPKRLKQILRALKPFAFKLAIRSLDQPIEADTEVYIADSFGELGAFIAGSEFVIMGGGFSPFGGQNIVEAAHAGKAVIFGSHMENFDDEARQFVAHQAGIQVKNEAMLCESVARLLAEPEEALLMGNNGRALIAKMDKVAEDYLEKLEDLLPLFQSAAQDR